MIPTKNRADLLPRAIESVLSQDYPNIQCIVADGGSSDGTLELLKRYGDRIEWFSEPDRGAFDAINKGWAKSRGSILAWVNADDQWAEGAARIAVDYFQHHPTISVVYGSCAAINEKGEVLAILPSRPWDLRYAVENCDHIIQQVTSFMRREILEKVGYLYPAWCHDHDLWLRISLAGGEFANLPEVLGKALVWANNLGNNPAIIIPGKIGLTERFFATPGLPAPLAKLRRRAMSNAYACCIHYLSPAQPRNWPIALRLLCKAIAIDPLNAPFVVYPLLKFAAVRVLKAMGFRRWANS